MNMFNKTTAKTPAEYFATLEEPRKDEIKQIDAFIRKTVPKLKPIIVSGMLGYGPFHYKSKSGREGEWALILLASQKNYISIYVCAADGNEYFTEKYKSRLGKASIGKSCIRYKKIEDIEWDALADLMEEAEEWAKTNPPLGV